MAKEFIAYEVIRNNALKIAHAIYKENFIPDVIYVSLRGGAYMGNVISEYFKIIKNKKKPVLYAAVVARSYNGVHQESKIRVDGWTYDPKYLRSGDKILFIDDIFDTGRTLNFLVEEIINHGINREDIKVVVHDYKVVEGMPLLSIQPDFYARKIYVTKDQKAPWIHYMSHELEGLTEEEIKEQYVKKDPSLEEALSILKD